MNTKQRSLLVASAVLFSGVGLTGIAQAGPSSPTPSPAPASAPTNTAQKADASLAKALTFSREEERMARDLYAALAKKYDDALPFSRITLSEQRHFDSVGMLLTRYGVADPAAGLPAGTYADPAIQGLYDGWLAQGSKSLTEAYQVGIALEKRDIADLKAELKTVKQTDVKYVFERLLAGSQNHLRAFTAASQGKTGSGMGQGGHAGQGARLGQNSQAGKKAQAGQGQRRGQQAGQRAGQGRTAGQQGQGMGRGQGRGAGKGTPRADCQFNR
ncbi:DUF2202 domain-containing protein [Luteococcus sp. H138]|uniref:DUF2202 domain-containing protein n=1 Tax=unclassified Luteococcus TaxID=2639923 RepID=UPI00313BA464